MAFTYRLGQESIPTIDYNKNEIDTWAYCYPKLKALLATNACDETNQTIADMETHVDNFSATSIP